MVHTHVGSAPGAETRRAPARLVWGAKLSSAQQPWSASARQIGWVPHAGSPDRRPGLEGSFVWSYLEGWRGVHVCWHLGVGSSVRRPGTGTLVSHGGKSLGAEVTRAVLAVLDLLGIRP